MSVIDCVSSILCWELAMLCPPTGKFRRIQGKRKQARSAVTKDTTLHSINEPVVLEHCCGPRILYTLRTHAQAHANTRLCVTSWFHGYYEKNLLSSVLLWQELSTLQIGRYKGNKVWHSQTVWGLWGRFKQSKPRNCTCIRLIYPFYHLPSMRCWIHLASVAQRYQKVASSRGLSGFTEVHLRHTLKHYTHTNCQSTDWNSSLFVSFPPIAYLSYFHLWRWEKGWN